MTNMEIIIKEPIEFLNKIETNLDDVIESIKVKIEKYDNLVYTEKDIPEAKKDRANFNKSITVVKNSKRDIKKRLLVPLELLEPKFKEAESLFVTAKDNVDGQLKAFDTRTKEAKRADITKFFNDNVGELGEVLKLADIFDDRWLNSSFKMKDIDATLLVLFQKMNDDIEIIKDFETQYTDRILDVYIQTRNLKKATEEKNRLIEQTKRLEEMERLKIEREAKEKAIQDKLKEQLKDVKMTQADGSIAEYQAPVKEAVEKVDIDTGEIFEEAEPTKAISLTFFVTAKQKRALWDCMKENDIKFEVTR